MPEGDTLHKVALALAPWLTGQKVLGARIAHWPAPLLVGLSVARVAVHGKHLVFELAGPSGGFALRVHLGMYGSWHRYAPGEAWRRPRRQAQVVLEVREHCVVCFNAQDAELWPHGTHSDQGVIERLGPDLLAPEVSISMVVARARRLAPRAPLTDLLLDQRVAAGIGNVYKCELMFVHRLAPLTPAFAVDDAALSAVYASARTLMQQNLGPWRRTTTYDRRLGRDPRRPRLFVYGRAAEPCQRCATAIERARLGRTRRSTYWCPRCQAEREGVL